MLALNTHQFHDTADVYLHLISLYTYAKNDIGDGQRGPPVELAQNDPPQNDDTVVQEALLMQTEPCEHTVS